MTAEDINHQPSKWIKGSTLGKCQVGILTLHDSPALLSTQILDFTHHRFFSPLWGWGWRRGFCLNPSSETSFLLSRTPNGLLRWKCAMLSVAFNNLLLFVGHPCSLITHFTVFLEVSSSSVGRGPSQPPFLTRKWQEIGLSDWRALSRQWIQASHLRKICTHQFSPVLGQVKRQATWAAGWESKSPTFNRSWRE